ncbi:hypothetical protein BABINDRAFT_51437 [Babjeviella inositovora NRRL Y-12698]|uniref:CCR4-Not complex 3'-5'-exoribonuclease subunit Ccr4 n=1 Tax=Babjeviella inositovora NRRL Y-12698 TaxID=984486 RepID=A0A1E3QLR1_9ASCO|nr:uncharacterized protein BABINDRAFT_51437 [Babjeviella inositovora NRRL Y-12698]ODQ78636.1 hypothetical protein BABINDRAFT_51437 [Babjeviella inositovora NRRL Y-12698]
MNPSTLLAQTFQATSINLGPSLLATVYWQNQMQLAQFSRKTSQQPHFYARQSAASARKKGFMGTDTTAKPTTLVDVTKGLLTTADDGEKQAQSANPLLQNKKLVIDDEEHEEEALKQQYDQKQLWSGLDLGGQGVMSLSPNLFRYSFLTRLYLCNNKLTAIPEAVSKLKNLSVLDLSNNQISTLPAEMGTLFRLKYLYLFDNQINQIPFEFGNLFKLEFLGIEGNPLDLDTAKLLAERGTARLILHLRDNAPECAPPKEREWILLHDDGEPITDQDEYARAVADSDKKLASFTLMSYNTLCHHYATPKMYKYTPLWALEWNYRREQLRQQILGFDSDVLCLYEVETKMFEDFWSPLFAEHGYRGVFYCKTRAKTMSEKDSKKVDGCATFYKWKKFDLLEKKNIEYTGAVLGQDKYKKTDDVFNRFMNKDNIALVTLLRHIDTGNKIVVACTHLHWDPKFNDVKTVQVAVLLEELTGLVKKYNHVHGPNDSVKNYPLIICGDFNSDVDSAVYELFSQGSVSKHLDTDGRDYGKFTDEGFHHQFSLRSAYDSIGELPFTNLTPSFTDVIDYIWYSTTTLSVKGLLGKIDPAYLKNIIGFPNAHFPSDHIPLISQFSFKKARDTSKGNYKPDFKSGSRKV